jgi:CheY-like chemotaxis protein
MTEATRRDQLTVLARKAAVLNKNQQPLMAHEEVFQVAEVHPNKSISYKMLSNPWSNPKKGIVCVVDDQVPNLKALVCLLSAVGLQAVPFDNPRLFLEYVKDHSISLAIIDLRMPDLTGLDVQRMLYDICPEVPVIIITGEQEPGIDRTIALEQGAIAFLFKPFEVTALLEAIRTVPPIPNS